MNWFAVFLYLWAAGISGALAFVPSEAVGRRFFRFHAVILLVLGIAATMVGRPFFDGIPRGTLGLLGAAIAWALVADLVVISAFAFSRTRPIVPIAFLLPVITGGFLALTVALGEEPGKPGKAALLTAHLLTTGALLGSVLVAMNLGHSYLQNAALSFDHLARLARLFLGSAIAKLLVSLILLIPLAVEVWSKMGDDFGMMLVLVRVGVTMTFYPALAIMVLSCAKSRANQSATGILYAAMIIVLIGEGISMYLTIGRGIRA